MRGPYSQSFGYDVWGNRTHREGWGGSYGSYTNATSTYTDDRVVGGSYDDAGNNLAGGVTYDATGQLIFDPGGRTHAYDGDGMRGKKIEGATTTYYLRSSVLGGQVVAEISSSGSWNRGYVYLSGQLLAIQYGGVSWLHQEPFTKRQRVTDSAGNITTRKKFLRIAAAQIHKRRKRFPNPSTASLMSRMITP